MRESDGEGAWAKFYGGGGEHCGGIAVSLPGSVSAWRVHCTHSLQHCLSTSGYQTSYTYKVGSQLSYTFFVSSSLIRTSFFPPSLLSSPVPSQKHLLSSPSISYPTLLGQKTRRKQGIWLIARLNWDSLVSCRPFTLLGLGWRVERYGYRRLESEGEQVNY